MTPSPRATYKSRMARVTLRRATQEDAVWLDRWDTDADVIACSSDDPDATIAFQDTECASPTLA